MIGSRRPLPGRRVPRRERKSPAPADPLRPPASRRVRRCRRARPARFGRGRRRDGQKKIVVDAERGDRLVVDATRGRRSARRRDPLPRPRSRRRRASRRNPHRDRPGSAGVARRCRRPGNQLPGDGALGSKRKPRRSSCRIDRRRTGAAAVATIGAPQSPARLKKVKALVSAPGALHRLDTSAPAHPRSPQRF